MHVSCALASTYSQNICFNGQKVSYSHLLWAFSLQYRQLVQVSTERTFAIFSYFMVITIEKGNVMYYVPKKQKGDLAPFCKPSLP